MKKIKYRYLFLYEDDNVQKYYMYKDVVGNARVDTLVVNKSSHNSFLHKYYAKKMPFSDIAYSILQKKEDIFKYNYIEKTVIVVNDILLNPYYVDILLKYKQLNPEVEFVCFFLNCINKTSSVVLDLVNKLSPIIILTDDPEDAKKFGWLFWMDCLSDLSDVKQMQGSDVFFAGAAKDREDELINIFEIIKMYGLNPDFTIVGGKKEVIGIKNSWIGYEELLSRDLSTNCVLEVMQHGQTGYTCRAQEAIVFNKKLLTNNKWIKNSKFYNPDYIHIFEKFGEGEIEFIKNNNSVNYNYNGEFSPLRLIEYIDDYLHNKG